MSADSGAVDRALAFIRLHARAVLVTHRSDGGLQSSPVAVGVDAADRLVVSTPSRTAKARNLRREPLATLCVVPDDWYGPWASVDVTAEVVGQPDALPLLEDYYRRTAHAEDPDWSQFRAAMTEEGRVLLRLTPTRAAGPGANS